MSHTDALALIEALEGNQDVLGFIAGVLLGAAFLRVIFR